MKVVLTLKAAWWCLCVMAFGTLSSFGQTALVRVDGISKDYPGNVVTGTVESSADKRNVRVSSSSHTYELTCNIENRDCTVPAVGTQWRLQISPKEKPDSLDDLEGQFPQQGFEAFLKSGTAIRGPYWLVSVMPVLNSSAYEQLLRECAAKEKGITENDCTRWLARRTHLLARNCSGETGAACRSFRELLRASDSDLIDILGRLGEVYVCYRPEEDSFFTLYFADPNAYGWRKSEDSDKASFKLPSGYLVQIGIVGVNFYEKGVAIESNQINGVGQWSYLVLDKDLPWKQLTKIAVGDAKMTPLGGGSEGPEVDDSLVKVTESYKNTKNEDVRHILQVQRSTGRYTETFVKKSTGETFLDYSGQCLTAPAITD